MKNHSRTKQICLLSASIENVLASGFGKFCVKDKRQRKGSNPATERI
jgi:nucleoid DNA-binding protein